MKRKIFITLSGILLLAFVSFCLSSLVTPKKTTLWQGILDGFEEDGVKTDEIVWKYADYYDDDMREFSEPAEGEGFDSILSALQDIQVRRTLTKGEYGEFHKLRIHGQYKGTLKDGVYKVYEIKANITAMEGGKILAEISGIRSRALYFQSLSEVPPFIELFE